LGSVVVYGSIQEEMGSNLKSWIIEPDDSFPADLSIEDPVTQRNEICSGR